MKKYHHTKVNAYETNALLQFTNSKAPIQIFYFFILCDALISPTYFQSYHILMFSLVLEMKKRLEIKYYIELSCYNNTCLGFLIILPSFKLT